MKYLRLVLANLLRSKRRTFLTVFSIAVALFLFCTLRTVITSFEAAMRASNATRLVVRHAASLVFPLPLAYRERLAQVPGVTGITYGNWFGGYYQDPKNQFAQFAMDVSTFDALFPECVVSEPEKEAFRAERTACIIGRSLARKYGWKIGDEIPIIGTIFPGEWRFTVRGIYTGATKDVDENTLFFHWDYLDQSLPAGRRSLVGLYWLRIASPDLAPAVSRRVDAIFENSAQPTKTETEKAFQAGFISMLGNVRLLLTIIGSAIVFAILLVTINTMMMAARERTAEIAILKSLGFGDGRILFLVGAEAVLLSLAGGLLGSGLAALVFHESDFTGGGFFPNFRVLPETVVLGLGLALVMGIVSGIVPAIQAARLRVADAIRKVA